MLLIYSICSFALLSSSALADEVYTYTGPGYVTPMCSGTYVANCTSYHLTGSLTTTLSLAQLENLTAYALPVSDVSAFYFTDGGALGLSQVNATITDLAITTNTSGNIEDWEISLQGDGNTSFVDTYVCRGAGTCPGGTIGGQDSSGTSAVNFGATQFEPYPGTWSGPNTPVPEPSAIFLAALGSLLLLGFGVTRQPQRN